MLGPTTMLTKFQNRVLFDADSNTFSKCCVYAAYIKSGELQNGALMMMKGELLQQTLGVYDTHTARMVKINIVAFTVTASPSANAGCAFAEGLKEMSMNWASVVRQQHGPEVKTASLQHNNSHLHQCHLRLRS